MDMQAWMLLLSVLVLLLVSASALWLIRWLWPDAGWQRLSGPANTSPRPADALDHWISRLPAHWRKVLEGLSRWSLPARQSIQDAMPGAKPDVVDLPLQLLRAGWRSPHALWLYGASKSLLTILGFVLGAILAWRQGLAIAGLHWSLLSLGLAGIAYVLPNLWLRWCTARRQQKLFRAFPDALDMLRICVQAGLGLDAAIERVGREMRLSSPCLSDEWRLTGLELRAGASRRMALEHLAERVGLREVDALVTMLIQADRFGTRMSEALQVHADVLRTQRKHQAEAAAAQLPVKLLIPLIFCIFPALLTVMLGPVGLSLYEHFSKNG